MDFPPRSVRTLMAEQIPVEEQATTQLVHTDEPPLHATLPKDEPVGQADAREESPAAPLSPITNQPLPNTLCIDCKQNMYLLGEANYVVHDQLWESAFPKED